MGKIVEKAISGDSELALLEEGLAHQGTAQIATEEAAPQHSGVTQPV